MAATDTRADYIRTRAQDDQFYMKLISDYLAKSETAPRSEIDKLLWDKLSDALDSEQKKVKINNLISKMRQEGMIENVGSRKAPKWQKLNK